MNKVLAIIVSILSLNLIFGYLYQISNEVTCLTELYFLGIGGLLFWSLTYRPLKRFTLKLIGQGAIQGNHVAALSGLGILVSVVNLFFCQYFIITSFSFLYGCISPSFNTLNASLTNNIAGNLLCYMTLIGFIIYENRPTSIPGLNMAPDGDFREPPKTYLLIPHHKRTEKVNFEEISHITVQDSCITIHTSKRKYVKYQSLKSILLELPDAQFKRIHRSTVINLAHLESVQFNQNGDGKVLLNNGQTLRLSRSYKKEILTK